MALVDKYLKLITSQHRGKPKFKALLEAVLKPSDKIFELAAVLDDCFGLDLAEGDQLDIIGNIVGEARQLNNGRILNDEQYNILLKAKIIKNHWKGNKPELLNAWNLLFPENQILVRDNQDMTMNVELEGPFKPDEYDMILNNYVVPKPQSVRLNQIQVNLREKATLKTYIGLALTQSGTQTIKTALPTKATLLQSVGGAVVLSGQQVIKTALPTKATSKLFSAGMFAMTGVITIGARRN